MNLDVIGANISHSVAPAWPLFTTGIPRITATSMDSNLTIITPTRNLSTAAGDMIAPLMSEQFTKVSDFVRVLSALSAAVTMVLGIPANILIILTVQQTKSLRTSMNVLVINLLVADLVNCVFCCPLIVVLAASVPHVAVCKLFDLTHILSGTVQLGSIAFLSFERYQAIRRPFDVQERLARIKVGIVVCWMLGAALSTLSVCMTTNPVLHLCLHGPDTNSRYEFGLYVFLPLSAAAIGAIVAFYVRIVYQINDHVAKRQKRAAWKRKVNKVNPIVSVTVALVNGTANMTSSSGQTTTQQMMDDMRTSLSDIDAATDHDPSAAATSQINTPREHSPELVISKRRTMSDSEAIPRVMRKADQESNRSAGDLGLKPKYSHDSKLRQMGQIHSKVQGFLSPARERSYYHSNEDLSKTPKRNSSCTSGPVTFTALEKLHSLDPVSLDTRTSGKRRSNGSKSNENTFEMEIENQLPERRGKSKESVGSKKELADIIFIRPSLQFEATQMALPKDPHVDSEMVDEPSTISAADGHDATNSGHANKAKPDQKTETAIQKSKPTTPKRPTRRTAVIDVVQVHDYDGVTTQAKVASDGIVGDICVMNRESKEHGKRKVEQRTAKRTAITVAAFLGCWTPLLVAILVSVVLDHGSSYVIRGWCEAYLVTLSLALLAGVVNPVIYGVINNQFRSALIRMLRKYKTKYLCKR